MDCVIGGYHSHGQLTTVIGCDICGQAVCVEHRGLHWERAHKWAGKIDKIAEELKRAWLP